MDELHDDLRYENFRALLALADPPDLPRRRHHQTYPGDPSRKDHIKWELAAAYVGHRMQMHGHQDAVVSVRHRPLRLVKKSASIDDWRQIDRRTGSV
jgi:hypothetical protein